MIAIVDYGSGNVAAIANIYQRLRIAHCVSADPGELRSAERYILPGVGSFDPTMQRLIESGLSDLLTEQVVVKQKKVLGICVGMQVFAESSEEGALPGLGWIPGRVRKLDETLLANKPKLPHMGWNSIQIKPEVALFQGVDPSLGFYFLHSYFFDASDPSDVSATVFYGRQIPCALARSNVFGMQFHPEKSHANGVAVLSNFSRM